MTNAQSKVLFSTSKLTEDRSFKKNVKIIDASSLDIKKLIADAENVSHALTLDLEGAFTPLYAPRFADKESEDDSEDIPFFYVVGNGSDEIPSNMILKAPASSCHHFLVLVSKADAIRAGVAVDGCYPIPVEKLTGTRYAGKKDMIILFHLRFVLSPSERNPSMARLITHLLPMNLPSLAGSLSRGIVS